MTHDMLLRGGRAAYVDTSARLCGAHGLPHGGAHDGAYSGAHGGAYHGSPVFVADYHHACALAEPHIISHYVADDISRHCVVFYHGVDIHPLVGAFRGSFGGATGSTGPAPAEAQPCSPPRVRSLQK